MPRIIVIGGGTAGSIVVAELLRRAQPGDIELTWLTGPRPPGRGVAYSTTDEQHLLNTRAASMGLFADDVGGFLAYAQRRGMAMKGSDFVPRARFGDYVEDALAREIAHARSHGVDLRLLPVEALSLRGDDASGYVVTAADGSLLEGDGVVLALGALPPMPLAEVSAAARASGLYCADAWRWPALQTAPGRIVVLGTSLTAVDMLQTAARRWPDAQLVAISRHGHLPQTHHAMPGQPYARQAELIQSLLSKPRIGDRLRELRVTADEEGGEWRALIDGLRGATPELWRSLEHGERARFLRHLRWLWESVRHRLPAQTAEEIAQLRAQGRLEIVPGRVRRIDVAGPPGAAERLDVCVHPRGGAAERHFAADLVIQATGLNLAVSTTDHPLVRQMIADGVACPDSLDLGLAVGAEGRLLRADGSARDGLRCLGILLRGSVWECSGLPEIRALARDIARDLPGQLPRRAP